jgi:hypothetical protein
MPIKVLKKNQSQQLLTEDQIMAVVKEKSMRYQALLAFSTLDPDAFYEAWRSFREDELPKPNVSFFDPKYPLITANRFATVEANLCRKMKDQLLDNFEQIQKYRMYNRDITQKIQKGKDLMRTIN